MLEWRTVGWVAGASCPACCSFMAIYCVLQIDQACAIFAHGVGARRIRRLVQVVCVVIALLWLSPLRASEQQTKFFEQLRNRQLFGLAERYCLEELNRAELPAHQRIELAYEFSRTLVQHALVVPREEQAELWNRSRQVLEQTRALVGSHERVLLLDLQAGFIPCTQGQSLKWQLELTPEDVAVRKQALSLLSTGIETLSDLETTIKQKIVNPVDKKILPRDKFTAPELRFLLATLQFELGQAYFEKAGLLDSADADRFSAIDQAQKWLSAAASADRNSEFGQTCQILLAGCARLEIDAPRALKLLDAVDAANPNQAISDQAVAERARILMMQRLPGDAANLLTKSLKNRQSQPGELVALRIQVLIELWMAATEKQAHALAKELDAELDHQLDTLKITNPGYWAIYCETLIATARDSRSLGAELADLVRKARGLYAAKQIPESIKAYAQASQSAMKSGKPDLAFETAFTKGSIEVDAGLFAEAAQSFSELAEAAPQNPRTVDARFLAAYALGRVYYAQPTKANREAYQQALVGQRRDYPDHSTHGEATWLMAQLEEKRLQNSAALKLYQEIPRTHSRGPAAAAASARCYDLIITRLRELKQSAIKWEADAEAKLMALLPEDNRRAVLSEEQATLALHLSNILLQSSNPAFERADRLLEWITRSAEIQLPDDAASDPPKKSTQGQSDPVGQGDASDPTRSNTAKTDAANVDRWRELLRVATRLRVVSLAGQGRLEEAERSLLGLASTSPGELLAIISGLSKLVAQAQDKPRHQLGELQLKVALSLKAQRDQLPAGEQRRLDQCIVEAYIAAGRYEEALEPYRALVRVAPKDSVAMANLAQLLMKVGKAARYEEALGFWKKVEELSKLESPAWFDARLNQAQCELAVGRANKGLRLIQVTKALHAEPKDAELKKRMEQLQKECEAAMKK